MKGRTIALCGAAHFLVDFCCAFLLHRLVIGQGQWAQYLLIYNFCAFAVQMPLGLLADKLGENARFAVLGVLLVGFSVLFFRLPLLLALLLGLGNALFHVGGGLVILNGSEKAGPLGLFVSPGALGIYLGTLLGKAETLPLLLPLLLLLPFAILLHKVQSKNTTFTLPLPRKVSVPLLALLAVVILRSLLGTSMDFPWKAETGLLLLFSLALGKAMGGLLADRIGLGRAVFYPLLLSALLFLFSNNALCGLLAVFLFNMSMPLTLYMAARRLPGTKGFAFGLLTFGLFLGFLPSYLQWQLPASGLFYTGLSLASLLPLLYAWRKP